MNILFILQSCFRIKGSTAVEIASGLHWYLKYWCSGHVSLKVAKGVLKEHLILLANSMTCAGNFVGFNSSGYKALSRSVNIQVPFTEATVFLHHVHEVNMLPLVLDPGLISCGTREGGWNQVLETKLGRLWTIYERRKWVGFGTSLWASVVDSIFVDCWYNDGDPLSADDQSFILDTVLNYHPNKAVEMDSGIGHLTVCVSTLFLLNCV
ncbi:hypothetical protein ACFX2C_028599 [Malus domestica]